MIKDAGEERTDRRSVAHHQAWLVSAGWRMGIGETLSLSQCPYYRGVGTCTFGCYDYPQCMDLGPPKPERLVAFLAKVYQRLNSGAHWTNVPDPDGGHVCQRLVVALSPAVPSVTDWSKE